MNKKIAPSVKVEILTHLDEATSKIEEIKKSIAAFKKSLEMDDEGGLRDIVAHAIALDIRDAGLDLLTGLERLHASAKTRDLAAEVDELRAKIAHYQRQRESTERVIDRFRANFVDLARDAIEQAGMIIPERVEIGGWECPDPDDRQPGDYDNPIGFCVYDDGADGDRECLFCGAPEERQ